MIAKFWREKAQLYITVIFILGCILVAAGQIISHLDDQQKNYWIPAIFAVVVLVQIYLFFCHLRAMRKYRALQ